MQVLHVLFPTFFVLLLILTFYQKMPYFTYSLDGFFKNAFKIAMSGRSGVGRRPG